MYGRMMFGDIVAKIDSSRFPERVELVLSCLAVEPMETHVHRFEAFACNIIGDNAMYHCIVSLHGCGWFLWPIS